MKYSPTYSSIQLKRGTSDRWLATNPILLQGEVGLEVISNTPLPDTYRIKIGDGTNTWQTLPYHIGVDWTEQQVAAEIKLISENTLSLSQAAPPLMIGTEDKQNLAFDNNEIQSRSNGLATTLYLQSYGGNTSFGASNASNNSNLIVNGSLTMLEGATVNATISSSGHMLLPRQPLFSASDTRALVVNNAVLTSANCFNQIDYNVGNHFNASTGRFTAPVAGYYEMSAHIGDASSASTGTNIRLSKNGSLNTGPLAEGYNQVAGGAVNVFVKAYIYCAAGDYLEFQVAALNTLGGIQHKRFLIRLLQ